MPNPVQLTTERLVLRPWRESDKEAFAALNADPRVMEFFPACLNQAESDALAERMDGSIRRDGWGLWALERSEDSAFLGFVGLNRVVDLPFSPVVEVGWRLAHTFWGHGYATEAARAAMSYAFSVLGEAKVVAFTAVTNLRSQAVMRRLGMETSSGFEHPRLPLGHPLRPHVLFTVARAAWPEAKIAFRLGEG